MKVVFVSNYYNHHQAAVSKAMDRYTQHQYYFIETAQIEEERKKLGWGNDIKPKYVIHYNDNKNMCKKLIEGADVVIWGSCPFSIIKNRLKKRKLTFAYSERIFKKKLSGPSYWMRAIKYFIRLKPYQKNHYLLCSSAYASLDYNRIYLFKDKAYKWGYFPEKIHYEIDELIRKKNKYEILWVSRFIDWKHPEIPIMIAKKLIKDNYKFKLNMIGNGALYKKIEKLIEKENLNDYVHLLGGMNPNEVRKYMENASIFLFTSDQNEGWGAVLNEAMNSGCAVIANSNIGSTPYLVTNGVNGLTYVNDNLDEIYHHVTTLLNNHSYAENLGKNAYHLISNYWNADIAVKNFFCLISGKVNDEQGICSKDTSEIDLKT